MPADFTKLPRHFLLARSTYERPKFNWENWDPKKVQMPTDLPPYLVLGDRDDSHFKRSKIGWECSWIGSTSSTVFNVRYDFSSEQFEVNQTWQGIAGYQGFVSTKTRLDKFILQNLHREFPEQWDDHAKLTIEKKYQVEYIGQPKNTFTFAGMPDGFFRTIAFVVSAQDLQTVEKWVIELINHRQTKLPVVSKIQRISQAINYVESKAADWTRDEWKVFLNAFEETGFPPLGLPVRELAQDGTAAWTVRRIAYAVFLTVPFSGLIDFLLLATTNNGPLRLNTSDALTLGLKPIIIAAGLDVALTEIQLWDENRTTRCVWILRKDDELDEILALEADMYLERESHSKVMAIVDASSAAFEEFIEMTKKN